MATLEAVCPQCQVHYYGWALTNREQRWCGKCEVPLRLISTNTDPHYQQRQPDTRDFQDGLDWSKLLNNR